MTDDRTPQIEKRPRYFDGQFLKVDDFNLEQRYHIDRQRRLSQCLQVSGILRGLDVEIVGPQLKLSRGSAIDNKGRQIVLYNTAVYQEPLHNDPDADPNQPQSKPDTADDNRFVIDLSPLDTTTMHQLLIAWEEFETDEQSDASGGSQEATRLHERPRIYVQPTPGTDAILLAKLTYADDQWTLDLSGRQYSGVQLPASNGHGAVLRSLNGDSEGTELSSSLSINGRLTIEHGLTNESNNSQAALEVKTGNIAMPYGNYLVAGPLTQDWSTHKIIGAEWNEKAGKDETQIYVPGSQSSVNPVMRLCSDGNVGIGVAPGPEKLKVEGNTAITGDLAVTQTLSVSETSTLSGNVGIGVAPGPEKLKVEGNTAITGDLAVTQTLSVSETSTLSGNVGIGVAPDDKKLKVGGDTAITGDLAVTQTLSVTETSTLSGNVGIGVAPGPEKLKVEGNTAITGDLAVTQTLSVSETSTLSGNVGIGVAPDDKKLKVGGDTAITGDLAVTQTLSVSETSTLSGNVGIGVAPGTEKLKVEGNTAITGDLAVTQTLSVTETSTFTGNVGIGSSSSNARLHVEHNSISAALSVEQKGSGNAAYFKGGGGVEINAENPVLKLSANDGQKSTLQLRESTGGNYGVDLVYDGSNDTFYVEGMDNHSSQGQHLCIKKATGNIGIGVAPDDDKKLKVQGHTTIIGRLSVEKGETDQPAELSLNGTSINKILTNKDFSAHDNNQTIPTVKAIKAYLQDYIAFPELIFNLTAQIDLEMVRIPAGEFLMGSPESETGRSNGESPRHRVKVPQFYIGKYPITQEQYNAIMGQNPSRFKDSGEKAPVEKVDWNNASEFCQKLSDQFYREFALPTEAQWEYACRAGTTTAYYFGNEAAKLDDYAWFSGNSDNKTHPVGQKMPNAWGLYDMHGNVYEWCQDDWHSNYDGAPLDGSAWIGGTGRRIARGGSWYSNPRNCRSALRFNDYPVDRTYFIGFRVVCSAPRILP